MMGSIFRSSLVLAIGGALALAVASILLLIFSPVRFDFPLSNYEVGRLLGGRPVARSDPNIVLSVEDISPHAGPSDAAAKALSGSLAQQLGVAPEHVVLAFDDEESWIDTRRLDLARTEYERLTVRSVGLYQSDPRYAPLIFRPFRAALRLPDGRWRTVSRLGPPPGPQFQWGILKWISLVLLMIVPIAWFFSQRIARPIRAFADAADRIGGGSFERVGESGPVEIRTAAAALNEMQARIERYVTERTAVVGAIAHDLRTPLARLSFLLADAPPEMRTRIDAEIAGMDRMIGVTLDYVQGETAQPSREPVDLRLVVESVIDDFADMGRDAAIEPGPPVTFIGDAVLLGRLFANVIDNALTYGGQARAHISVDGRQAIIDIDDDGPGMDDGDRERAFEPFFRGERSRNASTGGIGLGLSIVRSMVTAHGGTIALNNRVQGGLRVRVTLPLSQDGRTRDT